MSENTSSWYSTGNTSRLNELNKLKIWGEIIPGNSQMLKSEVMDIHKGLLNGELLHLIRLILTLKSHKLSPKGKRRIDTYTDLVVKSKDDDYRETFMDEPYLIPFIAEKSDKAVIVVPGGGYCYKNIKIEGTKIASALQKNGITAFVLWYRSNPYYQPYPLMDMQRAVRYVRFHAKEYGYSENKIGAIGFSAGGAQVSLFHNVMSQGLLTLPKYEKDAIDAVDDRLNFVAPIYPALNYRFNTNMLYASFSVHVVQNEMKRKEVVELYDVLKNMNYNGIPHFVCYGTKDDMVSIEDIRQYISNLKQRSNPCQVLTIEGAGHGYGEASDTEYGYWLEEFIGWVNALS